MEHSPALQLYLADPTTDRDDLFLMEADALMMALLDLKQFNLPAVPVHDALIIEDRPGVDTEHLACFALTRAYAIIANARAVARVVGTGGPVRLSGHAGRSFPLSFLAVTAVQ